MCEHWRQLRDCADAQARMSLRRSHMRCDEYKGSYMTGHFIWNVKYYTRPNDGTWKKTDNKCSRQPAHMQWIQKSAYYIGKQCIPRCGISSGSSLLAWKKHQFILKCNKTWHPKYEEHWTRDLRSDCTSSWSFHCSLFNLMIRKVVFC